jgi:hypothetical protein
LVTPGSSYSSAPFDPYSESLESDPWLLPSNSLSGGVGLGPGPAQSFLSSFDPLHHHHHFFRVPDQVYREKYQFDKFYIAGTEAYLNAKWSECVDQMNKALAAYKAYKWIEVKCRGLCKGEVQKDRQQQREQQLFRAEVNITFPDGGGGGGTTQRPPFPSTPSLIPTTPFGSTTPVSSTTTTTTTEAPGPKPPPVIEQDFHFDAISELQTFDSILHEALCISKCKASRLGPVAYHRFKKEVVHHFHELRPYDYLQLCYYKVSSLRHRPQKRDPGNVHCLTLQATTPDSC